MLCQYYNISISQYSVIKLKGGSLRGIVVNVICPVCNNTFEWKWGKTKGVCSHCDAQLHVREVKYAKGEVMKLFQ